MKTPLIKICIFVMIGAIFSTGCSMEPIEEQVSGDSDLLSSTPIPLSEETVEIEMSPTESVLPELSDQAYTSQSGAYKITLPRGWNCSETGEFQVNCQVSDQSAELQVKITATGYELEQKAFLSFTHAELVHAYSEVKEYVENERIEEEGYLESVSTWRDGEVYWQGTDLFIRTNGTILYLKTSAQKSLNENYSNLFTSITESIKVIPTALQGVQLYANRLIHTAPEVFFEVEVPTSWSRYIGAAAVENTILEGFLSPDKRAAVQIAVYNRGSVIDQTVKAEKTLEIMRAQYGYDLRVSHDKALPDGRERLAWYADNKGINGISYFDSYGNSLYVFSIVWEEPTAYIYQPLLEEIAATFTRE